MCIDDSRQVDLTRADLLLQNRCHPINFGQILFSARNSELHVLIRVCGIDDHGIFALVVHNQVGIVITTTRPYIRL